MAEAIGYTGIEVLSNDKKALSLQWVPIPSGNTVYRGPRSNLVMRGKVPRLDSASARSLRFQTNRLDEEINYF